MNTASKVHKFEPFKRATARLAQTSITVHTQYEVIAIV